jgi:hypothetical protein
MTEWVYHGTSTLYIPYILKDGLTGRYPDELYEELLFFWNMIPLDEKTNISRYTMRRITDFLDRQINIRKTGEIDISVTTDYTYASDYANGRRNNGEGPGFMMDVIFSAQKLIEKANPSISEKLHTLLTRFGLYGPKTKGIMLAIKVTDLIAVSQNELDVADGMIRCTFTIPPDIINIITTADNERHIFPIQSKEGSEYLDKIRNPPPSVSEGNPIGFKIQSFLMSVPDAEKTFIIPRADTVALANFQIGPPIGKPKSNGFYYHTSYKYPNFKFLIKTMNSDGDIILIIVPTKGGGKLKTGKLKTGKLKTGKLKTGKLKTGKLKTGKSHRRKKVNKKTRKNGKRKTNKNIVGIYIIKK